MSVLLEKANAIYDELVGIRRPIHRHPELGGKEFETSALIRKKLEEYGVDKIESPTETSVVATIQGTKGPGKCVALRCDIDALPVQESTGLPFSSEVDGVMHACGHDFHLSMMLGNAKILCGMRDQFAGSVKLIFEHSEEQFPGGARDLVKWGVMDGVDAIFGMHVFPTDNDKIGVVGLKGGAMTTSADEYWFTIKGTGGHGSMPHKAPDPILTAAQMIVMLQQVQSRVIAPLGATILMMNQIEGGVAPNIISDQVRMGGNARAYTQEDRDAMFQHVKKVVNAAEEISGCHIDFEPKIGYDPCFNDWDMVESLQPKLADIVGKDHLEMLREPMGFSEDFSFYSTLTGVPSVLFILKAGHVGNDIYTLHNACCAVREEAIPYGIAAMIGAALSVLQG